jgi:hypothetical protein
MIHVAHRKTLLAQGASVRKFHKRADNRSSRFRSIRFGIYADLESSTEVGDDWTIHLRAQLLQSGPGALVGLRSAARLHQFDGYKNETNVDTITIHAHHAHRGRQQGIFRSRTLTAADRTLIGGLPATTKARTLIDLGRVSNARELEYALESALRGPDPKKPYAWNEPLLDELLERTAVVHPNTGAHVLRSVLRRRPPGCLPTGSYAETSLWQRLRAASVGGVMRQCLVRFFDPLGTLICWFYLDFAVIERLVGIEVNGAAPRDGAAMTADDVRRLGILSRVMRMHVVPGADAGKPQTAVEIHAIVAAQPVRTFPAEVGDYLVYRTASGLDVHEKP